MFLLVFVLVLMSGTTMSALAQEADAPRPIAALDSVWTQELTWMEIRDAMASGKTTALILTGGVEANGPYVPTGKHNYILEATGEGIARKLGNALVVPILRYEPGQPATSSYLKRYRDTVHFLLENREFVKDYPDLTVRLIRRYFTIDDTPKDDVIREPSSDFFT